MKIIIYGTGYYFNFYFSSNEFCKWIKSWDYEIIGVMDGDETKQGDVIKVDGEEYQITHIKNKAGKSLCDKADYVIITSQKYYREIADQLIAEGIEEEKIKWIDHFIHEIVWPDDASYKYMVSIATMIKDEGPYMREWIEFHRLMGVEHIYIYDDGSKDDTKEILQRYIEQGFVTYRLFEGNERRHQVNAFMDAINSYREQSKYIALLDADEFLFSVSGRNIYDVIQETVDKYEMQRSVNFEKRCGGIGVNWRVYGFSGHETKPQGLIIENYMYRAADDKKTNAHIKTIYNPRCVIGVNCHNGRFIPGFAEISERGTEISSPFFYDSSCSVFRINHYGTRSVEEYVSRKRRPTANRIVRSEEEVRECVERVRGYSEVYDPILAKYIPQIRELTES